MLFSNDVMNVFKLNKYATNKEVVDAIEDAPYIGGTTNMAEAIKVTQLYLGHFTILHLQT